MSNNNSSPSQSNGNGKGKSEPVSPISPKTDARKRDGVAAEGRRDAISGPAANPAAGGRRGAIAGVLDGTEGSLNPDSAADKPDSAAGKK
ncbi:hypothetical protein PG996_009888 [Apiospora saccharicola]|uniref:SMP domain-containing protein n=1 Tax=Apiospora saccharicola TaxID=335842 RepID=A0ABR1UQ32_9PEZI